MVQGLRLPVIWNKFPGLLAFFMEANEFPIAPTILGMIPPDLLPSCYETALITA
jgi:TctA family transporter